MKEIELSTMVEAGILDLSGFGERTSIRARHRQFDWAAGWNNILQFAMRQHGPDISEVGSTWLDNLKELRALRPFSLAELNALGGEEAFLANGWPPDSAVPVRTGRSEQQWVTSIPWSLDTRLIFYRRDRLAKAGISADEAFATPESMFDTLRRLQSAGFRYPLGLATGGLVIHNLASWVWGRGGSFRSPDYRKISLVEAEARQGMVDFYRLHRFIDPATQGMNYYQTNHQFFAGSYAVMLSGQWGMRSIKEHSAEVIPEVCEHTGYAPPPGVPYVGSSCLVIWRHSLHDYEALRLIAHLTSPSILENVFKGTSNFPARLAALNSPYFAGDSDYQMVIKCIQRGRGFRSARLWAGIEARLNVLCDQLWKDLFANPELNLEAEIEQRLRDLAPRLEKTLMANW